MKSAEGWNMKTNNYYIIRFNDLSQDKQEEIKVDLYKRLTVSEDIREYLLDLCGSDPFDIDKPDCDKISDHLAGVVETGCDKASWELGIELSI